MKGLRNKIALSLVIMHQFEFIIALKYCEGDCILRNDGFVGHIYCHFSLASATLLADNDQLAVFGRRLQAHGLEVRSVRP